MFNSVVIKLPWFLKLSHSAFYKKVFLISIILKKSGLKN
jgi:hypothetical protein